MSRRKKLINNTDISSTRLKRLPAVSCRIFWPFMRARKDSGNLPNGRSGGKRRSRGTKQNKDAKGGRSRFHGAPALFAFMGTVSSSGGLSAWSSACASPRCESRWFHGGQRKQIIRTHHRLEIGSDYIGLPTGNEKDATAKF